jgi:hypothetical protein
MIGLDLPDCEAFAAIADGLESNSSVGQVLDCYCVPDEVEQPFSV